MSTPPKPPSGWIPIDVAMDWTGLEAGPIRDLVESGRLRSTWIQGKLYIAANDLDELRAGTSTP